MLSTTFESQLQDNDYLMLSCDDTPVLFNLTAKTMRQLFLEKKNKIEQIVDLDLIKSVMDLLIKMDISTKPLTKMSVLGHYVPIKTHIHAMHVSNMYFYEFLKVDASRLTTQIIPESMKLTLQAKMRMTNTSYCYLVMYCEPHEPLIVKYDFDMLLCEKVISRLCKFNDNLRSNRIPEPVERDFKPLSLSSQAGKLIASLEVLKAKRDEIDFQLKKSEDIITDILTKENLDCVILGSYKYVKKVDWSKVNYLPKKESIAVTELIK